MTFLVWLPWRLFQKGEGTPKGAFVVAAIFISAILFGIGHLPVASLLAGELTLHLAAYVITANSVFGIVAGFFYWKRGLESAMIAHMFAHVVLIIAIAFSL
jgi:membrane protease YdiL (CAAX protease family)